VRKYLQLSFYTLTGIRKMIDLGDQSYGEWLIYDHLIPKYHVMIFEKDDSNMLINSLISSKSETIDSIVEKINAGQGRKLSLGKRPLIKIVKKEELVDLELIPIPVDWIKNIN
jgi:hypothetical protein